MKPAHHRGSFHVQARQVRLAAYSSSATRCWRCGLTLVEIQAKYPKRKVTWQAGHLHDGLPGGALAPECSPCNLSNGARHGNQLRAQRATKTSRTW